MKRGAFAFGLAVLALVTSSVVPATAQTTPAATTTLAEHRPGVVLVGFVPSASASARADALRAAGAASSEPLSPLAADARIVHLGGGVGVEAAIAALSRNPNVRYAEPDYVVEASDTSDDTRYLDGSLWGMYGDSANASTQFGSQADQAWAGGDTGSRSVYVGIIDSGLHWQHADLAANAGNPNEIPLNNTDDDGNGKVDDRYGYDFVENDSAPQDQNGHGTHVAGTIGGVGGNGLGVAGVNWNVGLLSGRFLDARGSGYTSNAVKAVDYFTDLKTKTGLNVVATSNSWGGGGFSQSLLDAINRGGDAGILFIAAAGNSGTNNDSTASYPSNYQCTKKADTTDRGWDCVIAVAAIDANGAKASWSQYGATTVDLGAPGVGITSTWNDGAYNTISGTSMATPHVSGAAALCASMGSLTAQQIRAALVANTQPTTSLSGKTVSGGRLDVGKLVQPCGGGTVGRTTAYALAISMPGNGSGTVTGAGTTCTAPTSCTISNRTGAIRLTATAATGTTFQGWTGCATSTRTTSGGTCTVYLTQARSVVANFTANVYSFKLSIQRPSGTSPSVSVSTTGPTIWTQSCTSSCSKSVGYGTVVTMTANTVTGAQTVTWSGCDTLVNKTCTVTVNSSRSVTVKFTA